MYNFLWHSSIQESVLFWNPYESKLLCIVPLKEVEGWDKSIKDLKLWSSTRYMELLLPIIVIPVWKTEINGRGDSLR
jgi:hypothetical protein